MVGWLEVINTLYDFKIEIPSRSEARECGHTKQDIMYSVWNRFGIESRDQVRTELENLLRRGCRLKDILFYCSKVENSKHIMSQRYDSGG